MRYLATLSTGPRGAYLGSSLDQFGLGFRVEGVPPLGFLKGIYKGSFKATIRVLDGKFSRLRSP